MVRLTFVIPFQPLFSSLPLRLPLHAFAARPFLPITGFVVGTGQRKLGGNTAVDDYASVSVRDGDRVTVVYDADAGALTFLVNGMSLGEAYRGLSGPVVAALAINSAGAMWSLDCNG